MKNLLKKYYELDEETKKFLPFLYMYQELISAIDSFDNIKIRNMQEEEILMETIIKCWYSTDLDPMNIIDKLLTILNCKDISIKDFENLSLDELQEIFIENNSNELLKQSKDIEKISQFFCKGYDCKVYKYYDKYFLILIFEDDADILIFNDIEEIFSKCIEYFLLEKKIYG